MRTPTNQIPHFFVRQQHKQLDMNAPVYRLGDPRAGLSDVLEQIWEHVRIQSLLHITYARSSLPVSNRPKVTTRVSRFLKTKFDKDRKSKRRMPWDESSMCHYWIEGCLTNSNTRFRKFFRSQVTTKFHILLTTSSSERKTTRLWESTYTATL